MDYSFGSWIKRRRKALDLTQQELARQVGCSTSAIFKIESDERRPSRQIAELLAVHLEIPPEQQALFLKVARQEKLVETLGELPAVELPLPQPAPHRLPATPTPVFGREFELQEIARLIQEPQCRLLSLTGQGGIGKTHLALHTAVEQAGASSRRIVFVSLAPVTGREETVTAIADALEIVLYSASDRSRQLISYLQDKEILLILDNFEHLAGDLACTALINDLLHGAQKVKVMITSRQPVYLQAEWIFEVQGLPVPKSSLPAELEKSSAVKLFLQRAGQSNVTFKPGEEDLFAIARICELVEGLPLGIELAASWVRTLACLEIEQEIRRSMDFLATSVHDLPERHRSIRATIEHSWKLLSLEEQGVLSRLSIFRGGFNRSSAEAVAGASLSVLSALVAKSLLRRAGPGRYDMHEVIRQYALGQLQTDKRDYEQVGKRYTRHFTTWLAEREPAFKGAERPIVVAELLADLANLRQVWRWAASRQQFSELSKAADLLFWLYESRSNCREGVPLYGEAVEQLQQTIKSLSASEKTMRQLALGQALSYKGFFLFRQGQHPQAKETLQGSVNILQSISEQDAQAVQMALSTASIFLGTVTSVMGAFAEGNLFLRQGLELKQKLGDAWGLAFCLRQVGLSAQYQGDYERADEALAQSLTISRELGNTWSIAASLNQLGNIAHLSGEYGQARQYLLEGLALSRELEDRASIAVALDGLGLISTTQGEYKEAVELLQESRALWSEIGELGSLAQTLTHLGDALLGLDDLSTARKYFSEALRVAVDAKITPVMLDALIGEAQVRILEDRLESALEILVAVSQSLSRSESAKKQTEILIARLEAQVAQPRLTEIKDQFQSKDINLLAREIG